MANTSTKISRAYRLSAEAVENLKEIQTISGMNATAAVEAAIAVLLANMKPKPEA